MDASPDTLRDELKRLFGHDDFRAGQREIVEAAVGGQDTLAILPTGGGKSLTYQLPAMLLPGVTLVLSPLIALMKDQAENLPPIVAERATIINSSLDSSELGRRLALVKSGRIKMVYAAPERLRQPPFLHALRHADVSLVVVDEAHCISQWGHDFRPDYRAVGKAVQFLAPKTVLAVTATATPDVADDIERQLGRPLHRIVRPTYRDNLMLACRKVQGEDEKLWATLDLCKNTPGTGLVYAGSREKCEQLSRMLKRQGIAAGFYHAGLPPVERAAAQDAFMDGAYRVMAATVAFGMGVDKSDIRFLIHYNPSRTLENYYQEAGRAGRDGKPSYCTLLHSPSDASSTRRRLNEDTLNVEGVRAVYMALRNEIGRRRVGPVSLESLVTATNGEEGMIRSTLPLLEEAGLIARHTDLPRRLNLMLDDTGGAEEDRAYESDWNAFHASIGGGGDYDSRELSDVTGVSLPLLEETILRFQQAGHLVYRPGGGREMVFEILPPPPDTKQRMAATLAHRASGAMERAEAMLEYARGSKCRHGVIARYFGDRWPNLPCGKCDVCAGTKGGASAHRVGSGKDVVGKQGSGSRSGASSSGSSAPAAPAVDPARAPLAALQIVSDLAQGYRPFALGRTALMRSLRGTPDAPITQNRSAGFGALAALKKSEVERLVDALVDGGFLRRDEEDEYRRLYLTTLGKNALADDEVQIEWRMQIAAPAKPGKGEPLPADVDPDLLEALKTWRRALATEENVAPFMIFSDKVLLALASRKPSNEFDLLDIPGIGPAKAAKFGEEVLDMVRKFP